MQYRPVNVVFTAGAGSSKEVSVKSVQSCQETFGFGTLIPYLSGMDSIGRSRPLLFFLVFNLTIQLSTIQAAVGSNSSSNTIGHSTNKGCAVLVAGLNRPGSDLNLKRHRWNEITSFSSDSVALVVPEIEFTQSEISTLINELSLFPSNEIDKTYYYPRSKPNLRHFTDMYGFEPSIDEKIDQLHQRSRELFMRAYGYEPSRIVLTLRVTSNKIGRSITISNEGNAEGLHNHLGSLIKDKIDFVWSVKGQGMRIKFQDGLIREVPEGQLALIGDEVMHGSPDSHDVRLLVIGIIEGQ